MGNLTTATQRPARTGAPPGRQAPRRTVTPRMRAGGVRAVWGAVLLAFVLFFAIPLLWLLLAPTRTDAGLVSGAPLGFGSLRGVGSAWRHLMGYDNGIVLIWLRNSFVYSASATALTLAVSIPAGYGLALIQFIGRRTLLMITLIVMIMPPTTLVIPVFLEMNTAHLIGTAASVILPLSFFPFGIYLAYIYYSTVIPAELLDAGRIDGCGELRVFRSIALPLARPVVALVAFFAFVASWNNFFLPFVMLPLSSTYNLPLGLNDLLEGTPALNPALGGTDVPIHRPEVALAGLITALPILLVFAFSQRFLVAGMTAGASKG